MDKTSDQDSQFEIGVFSTVDAARGAVQGLLEAGFTVDEITVICSDETRERHFREFEHQQPAGTHTPAAAMTGGTIGAVLGGFTGMASAAATGGVMLWAAGPLVLAGGVAGGLIGAMMTRGVEKEIADYYQQAVTEGRILVAAEATAPKRHRTLARAATVLAEAGAQPLPLREG